MYKYVLDYLIKNSISYLPSISNATPLYLGGVFSWTRCSLSLSLLLAAEFRSKYNIADLHGCNPNFFLKIAAGVHLKIYN